MNQANVKNGEENWVTFTAGKVYPRKLWGKTLYQYDYRSDSGVLFSTVKDSLEKCRAARDSFFSK